MVWMVFPRPISSARIPFKWLLYKDTNHSNPFIYKNKKYLHLKQKSLIHVHPVNTCNSGQLGFLLGYLGSLKEETWIMENIEYTVHIQTYLVLLQFAIDHDRSLFCDVFMHSVSHRVVALLLSLGGTAMILIIYFLGSLSDDARHTMQSLLSS